MFVLLEIGGNLESCKIINNELLFTMTSLYQEVLLVLKDKINVYCMIGDFKCRGFLLVFNFTS